MQGRSSPQGAASTALAAEEVKLRARVQQMRLKRLAEETAMARVSLTREGAAIRAEINRLRAQITIGPASIGHSSSGAK